MGPTGLESANIPHSSLPCHTPIHPGDGEPGLLRGQAAFSVSFPQSSGTGIWNTPGGHGGKRPCGWGWLRGCTSKTAGSFARYHLDAPPPFYPISLLKTVPSPGRAGGKKGMSAPDTTLRSPHWVGWSVCLDMGALDQIGGHKPSPVLWSL